eukprot:5845151-Amphidinium_carterae.1
MARLCIFLCRRYLYSLVTMNLPDFGLRYYLHAVNAMEATPQFQFDQEQSSQKQGSKNMRYSSVKESQTCTQPYAHATLSPFMRVDVL